MTTDQRSFLPNFIIVGAQKSGTTSLFRYLSADEAVGMAAEKEVHFFDRFFHRGISWYKSRFPVDAFRNGKILGEATPLYMFHPLAVKRIKKTLPDCRLIAVLRNPIDRAYSHYHHEVALNHESRTFEEAVENEDALISREYQRVAENAEYFSTDFQRYSYLARGRYHEQVARLYDSFPAHQILVMQSERLFSDPEESLKRLHQFLGLETPPRRSFPNEYGRKYQLMSTSLRARLGDYFQRHNDKLFSLLNERFDW